jgi:hypothetical protein
MFPDAGFDTIRNNAALRGRVLLSAAALRDDGAGETQSANASLLFDYQG